MSDTTTTPTDTELLDRLDTIGRKARIVEAYFRVSYTGYTCRIAYCNGTVLSSEKTALREAIAETLALYDKLEAK